MSARATVKFNLDPKQPPKMTAAQRKRLTVIAVMPDKDIDYSDIGRSGKALKWTRPGALVSTENKQQITLRLDAEVLAFFRNTGKRYQSRINAALREYINLHRTNA